MLRAMKRNVLMAMVAAAVVAAACGKSSPAKTAEGSGSGSASGAALPVPPLGVDEANRFNYEYGKGADAYKKAVAAYKTKDWAAVKDATTAAIEADPYHLDAHHLRGVAEFQLGKPEDAVGHLATCLAQDYLRFHDELAADADLGAFWKTPQGRALEVLDADLGDQVKAELAKGVIVIARRSGFKWPSKPGAQWATTRGEVYALDLDTKRVLRLTHTGNAVAAILRSPSGETAVIGYDKVEMPDPAQKNAPPLLSRAWVEAYDAAWKPTTKRATIAKGRAAAVTFGAGDQLLVASIAANGRWDLGAATWSSVDRATGKTTKVAAPASPTGPVAIATVTLDDAWIDAPVDAVKAEWTPATATMPALAAKLDVGGKSIDVPESGKTARDSIAVSPGGKQIAFATWTDPCAPDAKRSLYVVDVATGQLKHLLTEASRFRSRWLDDDRLIYEDGKGHLRVWGGPDKRELMRADDKYGFALATLSSSLPPLCKTAPPEVEPDTGGEGAGEGSAADDETEGTGAAPGDGSGSDVGPARTPQ